MKLFAGLWKTGFTFFGGIAAAIYAVVREWRWFAVDMQIIRDGDLINRLGDMLWWKVASGWVVVWFIVMFLLEDLGRENIEGPMGKHKRGAKLISQCKFRRKMRRFTRKVRVDLAPGLSVPWTHIFIVGVPGMGKTTLINWIIQSLHRQNIKMLLLDIKGEFVRWWHGKHRNDVIMNVMDDRCDPIEPGEFLKGASVAAFRHHANLIVRPKNVSAKVDKNDFFEYTPQALVAAILWYWASTGPATMKRLIEFLVDGKLWDKLKKALERVPGFAPLYGEFIAERKNAQTQGVMSVVIEAFADCFQLLSLLCRPAALWLKGWLRGAGGIMFFPLLADQQGALRGLYRYEIGLIFNEIMKMPDTNVPQGAVILDELPAIDALPEFCQMLNTIRSKGWIVIVTCQETDSLSEKYGLHLTRAIINQCNTQIAFRLNERQNASEASGMFATADTETIQRSVSSGPSGESKSESSHFMKEPVVSEADIHNLALGQFYIRHGDLIAKCRTKKFESEPQAEEFIMNPELAIANMQLRPEPAAEIAKSKHELLLEKVNELGLEGELKALPLDKFITLAES